MSQARESEAQPGQQPQPISANVKETIESILVAFILAFIFRAFVVEAFVIPTGSMAPTLLGAHVRYRCPDCGYVFDVDFSHDPDDPNFPSQTFSPDDVYCPNCGYHVANGPLRDREGVPRGRYVTDQHGDYLRDAEGRALSQPIFPGGTEPEPINYGDRILVLKYAYLFNQPHRWDVVVFKAPAEPSKEHYTQNFIKRLVGEPGDTLMVLDGDIYLKDPQGNWQIQQRPLAVQQALWRVIYDNDFYPRGLPRPDRPTPWTQPWRPIDGQGWNLGHDGTDGRVFRFSGQGPATIAYVADANPGAQTINDYLVYDIPHNQRRPGGGLEPYGDRERNVVSDLKLAAWYQRAGGQGSLKLRLTKRDHAFVAEMTPDSATLWHTRPDGTTVADMGPVKLADFGIAPGAPLSIEFTNVDYRVTLRLNGKQVLQTTAENYAPDVRQLLHEYQAEEAPPGGPPKIEITAADQSCDLSHVGLWRNIYYTNNSSGMTWGTPNQPVQLHHRGDARDGGGVYGDDEYFVMGDNSSLSADARYWSDPIDLPYEDLRVDSGRVPGRFLLGKAFFVYWPAGFRPAAGFPALLPDFGDMRFIH